MVLVPQQSSTPCLEVSPHTNAVELSAANAGVVNSDYSRFLSAESRGRQRGPLWTLALGASSSTDGGNDSIQELNFSGGLPHPSTFPLSQVSFSFHHQQATIVTRSAIHAQVERPLSDELSTGKDVLPLDVALQYAPAEGHGFLRGFLKEHVARSNVMPYPDWDISLTLGSTDAVDTLLRTFCARGDSVLLESFCYTGTLDAMRPLGIKPAPVAIDDEGMCPVSLDDVLSSWNEKAQGTRPRVVIVVATGQNPTGACMSLARRQDIYAICRKHDLLLVSDEPYAALQISLEPGSAKPLPTSFLSLDTDARVVEVSTLSKILAPGLRSGWMVTPRGLIERFMLRNQVTSQGPSGLSMALLSSFFATIGGQQGWENYLRQKAATYSRRAQWMHEIFRRHLPLEICSWTPPRAGMFFWLHVDISAHPDHATHTPAAIQDAIFARARTLGVVFAPSRLFLADGARALKQDEVAFRVSYSFQAEQETDEGVRRFAQALRESFHLQVWAR